MVILKQLRSSTLIEVLTASVLLLVAFGASSMIFVQVTRSRIAELSLTFDSRQYLEASVYFHRFGVPTHQWNEDRSDIEIKLKQLNQQLVEEIHEKKGIRKLLLKIKTDEN